MKAALPHLFFALLFAVGLLLRGFAETRFETAPTRQFYDPRRRHYDAGVTSYKQQIRALVT